MQELLAQLALALSGREEGRKDELSAREGGRRKKRLSSPSLLVGWASQNKGFSGHSLSSFSPFLTEKSRATRRADNAW